MTKLITGSHWFDSVRFRFGRFRFAPVPVRSDSGSILVPIRVFFNRCATSLEGANERSNERTIERTSLECVLTPLARASRANECGKEGMQNVVEWRPRVAYIHWMDGLLATRRSHAEDGGERTRRLGGANLTFGRALALDLEIVGQELDVTLLGDVFASQKVLRESAKAVSDEARSFKVGARGGGALLIVQFLVGLRLGEQIRGEIGASRGDLEAHGGETGETEGERALGRVRLLRRRRLGRGVDLRANT